VSAEWIDRMDTARVVDVAAELGNFEIREAGAAWSLGPCPVCGAEKRHSKSRDKRGALGISKKRPQGWRCHQCDEKGDSLHFVALVLEHKRFGALGDDQKARVREWCERFLGMGTHASIERKRYEPPPPVTTDFPPEHEVRDLWALCSPVNNVAQVAEWLRARGIDPEKIAGQDIARALPPEGDLPRWARFGSRDWIETQHRVILPLVDHRGRVRTVIARRLVAGDDAPKSVAPQRPHREHPGFRRAGTAMASAAARARLADSTHRLERLLIAEGEIDLMTWATELALPALAAIGIFSGSWSPAWAQRFAADAEIVIATHPDEAGKRYAEQIEETLKSRARSVRWEPPYAWNTTAVDHKGKVINAILDESGAVIDANWMRMRGEALELPEVPTSSTKVPDWMLDEPPIDEAQPSDPDEWRHGLTLNSRGKIEPTLGNCISILQHHEPWKDAIAYDERSDRIKWLKCPPIGELTRQGPYPRALRDADEVWIVKGLEREWCSFSVRTVHDALIGIARMRAFDPVRDYLDGLKWDEQPRIDTWLERLCGAERSDYTRAVASKWLISAVARVYEPGCQVDHMLVLEGFQGRGKSSLLNALCSRPEWFSDQVADIRQRVAAAELLQGPWIVELGELDAILKADASTVKSFISSRVDKYRAAYARNHADHPRRIVFSGSTNEHVYLKDATGARRFWTIATTHLDVPGARAERDQLWAEAIVRYRAGERWYFDRPELVEAALEQQAARYVEDPWEHELRDIVHKARLHLATDQAFRITVEDCFFRLGIVERRLRTDKEAKRIVTILTGRIGLVRRQRRDGPGNSRRWAYELPDSVSPQSPGPSGDAGGDTSGDGNGSTPTGGLDQPRHHQSAGDGSPTGDTGGDGQKVNGSNHDPPLSPLSPLETSQKRDQENKEEEHQPTGDHARARAHAGFRYESQASLQGFPPDDDWDPNEFADPPEAY
jgi:hypothetical protein